MRVYTLSVQLAAKIKLTFQFVGIYTGSWALACYRRQGILSNVNEVKCQEWTLTKHFLCVKPMDHFVYVL